MNPHPVAPKPEERVPKPLPAQALRRPGVKIEDRALMTLGSLAFGILIPLATGLHGTLGPRDGLFWLGQAAYVALALAIWAGNRWLLLRQREHFDWFSQPWRKLTLLVAANVLYTAPLTAAALWATSRLTGQPLAPGVLQLVTAVNVICVLFVTHAYETLFLIRERESDLMRVERLERSRVQAELSALKAQVDPHFLFNSLNTLGHLIARDPPRARDCCDTLASIYRYVLASRERDLVPLAEEIDFLRQYQRLLVLRFGDAVQLQLGPGLEDAWLVPPLALQILLENAVKHNRTEAASPMRLALRREEDLIVASNPLQPRSSALPGSGQGLANLDERCRLIIGRALAVSRTDGRFEVRVPLRAEATGATFPGAR